MKQDITIRGAEASTTVTLQKFFNLVSENINIAHAPGRLFFLNWKAQASELELFRSSSPDSMQARMPVPVLSCSQQRTVRSVVSSITRGFERSSMRAIRSGLLINYDRVVWYLFAMADRIAYTLHNKKIDTELWLYSVWLRDFRSLSHSTAQRISTGDYSCLNAAAAAGIGIASSTLQREIGEIADSNLFEPNDPCSEESYKALNRLLEPIAFGA